MTYGLHVGGERGITFKHRNPEALRSALLLIATQKAILKINIYWNNTPTTTSVGHHHI